MLPFSLTLYRALEAACAAYASLYLLLLHYIKSRDIPARIYGLAVQTGVWLRTSLTQISAEVRKAVSHCRRVRDDALYKSTFTLLTFVKPAPTFVISSRIHKTVFRQCIKN